MPKSAILVIDMLNDFVLSGAVLEVPAARNIVQNIKKRLEYARNNNIPVIYVNDSHYKDDSEFKQWPPHAIAGTHGAEVIDDLKPQPEDYIVTKRRYSGFLGTSLDMLLRELEVKELIITGVVTDICVLHTAADGYMLGYHIIIPEDSVAALDDDSQTYGLSQMKRLYKVEVI
jgi:nicotinamidase-related amidase